MGVVCELSEPEKRQNTHHPQLYTRDGDRQLCGGGAWILQEIPEKFRKDPGNALRAFPGISLESTAGMAQTL